MERRTGEEHEDCLESDGRDTGSAEFCMTIMNTKVMLYLFSPFLDVYIYIYIYIFFFFPQISDSKGKLLLKEEKIKQG